MFDVGDRVICTKDQSGGLTKDSHGVVLICGAPTLVEFDDPVFGFAREILGHDGGCSGKQGHCFWVQEDSLVLEYELTAPNRGDLSLLGL